MSRDYDESQDDYTDDEKSELEERKIEWIAQHSDDSYMIVQALSEATETIMNASGEQIEEFKSDYNLSLHALTGTRVHKLMAKFLETEAEKSALLDFEKYREG